VDADTAPNQPAARDVGWGYCRISGNLEFILRPLFISLSFLSSPTSSSPNSRPLSSLSCVRLCVLFFPSSAPPSDRSSRLASTLRFAYVSSGFFLRFLPCPLPYQRPCEQPTDLPLFQMVGQQQLQRPPFSVGHGPSIQHNNMLSQFQNNGAMNQMAAPQLQAAFQQNRPTPAMLASLQPTQARQLELMMAQHQQPHNNLVASRLNPSQSVQQGFPQGMVGGNPGPGQPSQGKPFYYHFSPRLTYKFSQPRYRGSNVQWHDTPGHKTRCSAGITRSGSTPPYEHQSH